MPEGDTLARIAAVLRPVLVDKIITVARGRPGGAQVERVVGTRVESVEAKGKHLLIAFDIGLTLHTHLGLQGSWHHYRRGERWHRPAARAVAVLETPDGVAVCFDAPTVELIETRALAVHPVLSGLGADIAAQGFDADAAFTALRDPRRTNVPIGEALLDQRAVAGLGNVYRSELPFLERLDPFTPLASISDEALRRMLDRGAQLVRRNSAGGARITTAPGIPTETYVYGRTGRPCLRCGRPIRSRVTLRTPDSPPRRLYWCPSCQKQKAPLGGQRDSE